VATLSEMQTQLDALRKARASGVRRVEYTANGVGHSTEYRSDGELAAAIADLERRIAAVSRTPVRHVHFNSSKGL
jgi:hypothetical protein